MTEVAERVEGGGRSRRSKGKKWSKQQGEEATVRLLQARDFCRRPGCVCCCAGFELMAFVKSKSTPPELNCSSPPLAQTCRHASRFHSQDPPLLIYTFTFTGKGGPAKHSI